MKHLLLCALFVGATAVLGGVAPASSEAKPPAEKATEAEKVGLARIHRSAVEVFIGRSGFGLERMPLPLGSVLEPKSLAEGGTEVKDPVRKPPKLEVKHVPLAKFLTPALGHFPTVDKKDQWVVRELLPIGLVKHPKPVVYLEGQVPAAQAPAKEAGRETPPEKKELKTRKPDAFESESIEVIQGGGGLQAERRGQTMRAVAAIYAGDLCLKCHEHEGQMLGAFSYRLERIALRTEGKGK